MSEPTPVDVVAWAIEVALTEEPPEVWARRDADLAAYLARVALAAHTCPPAESAPLDVRCIDPRREPIVPSEPTTEAGRALLKAFAAHVSWGRPIDMRSRVLAIEAEARDRTDRRAAFREVEERAAADFASWPEWKQHATQVPAILTAPTPEACDG